jgi:LPXTG-motif cell wall-anchored protein
MSSLTSKINPLYIVLGFLVLLLVFMVARRK